MIDLLDGPTHDPGDLAIGKGGLRLGHDAGGEGPAQIMQPLRGALLFASDGVTLGVPDEPAGPALIAALSASPDGPDRWPSDDALKSDWLNKKFYGYLRRNRVLMILRAIEEHYQHSNLKSEPVLVFNFDKLEIEHIMPQKWEEHWALDPQMSREDRNWKVQGIGNLTLVSAALNKDMSHGPWIAPEGKPSKQKGLRDHTKLELNARLLRDYPEQWDEDCMSARAASLFEAAAAIWPSPAALLGLTMQPVATAA